MKKLFILLLCIPLIVDPALARAFSVPSSQGPQLIDAFHTSPSSLFADQAVVQSLLQFGRRSFDPPLALAVISLAAAALFAGAQAASAHPSGSALGAAAVKMTDQFLHDHKQLLQGIDRSYLIVKVILVGITAILLWYLPRFVTLLWELFKPRKNIAIFEQILQKPARPPTMAFRPDPNDLAEMIGIRTPNPAADIVENKFMFFAEDSAKDQHITACVLRTKIFYDGKTTGYPDIQYRFVALDRFTGKPLAVVSMNEGQSEEGKTILRYPWFDRYLQHEETRQYLQKAIALACSKQHIQWEAAPGLTVEERILYESLKEDRSLLVRLERNAYVIDAAVQDVQSPESESAQAPPDIISIVDHMWQQWFGFTTVQEMTQKLIDTGHEILDHVTFRDLGGDRTYFAQEVIDAVQGLSLHSRDSDEAHRIEVLEPENIRLVPSLGRYAEDSHWWQLVYVDESDHIVIHEEFLIWLRNHTHSRDEAILYLTDLLGHENVERTARIRKLPGNFHDQALISFPLSRAIEQWLIENRSDYLRSAAEPETLSVPINAQVPRLAWTLRRQFQDIVDSLELAINRAATILEEELLFKMLKRMETLMNSANSLSRTAERSMGAVGKVEFRPDDLLASVRAWLATHVTFSVDMKSMRGASPTELRKTIQGFAQGVVQTRKILLSGLTVLSEARQNDRVVTLPHRPRTPFILDWKRLVPRDTGELILILANQSNSLPDRMQAARELKLWAARGDVQAAEVLTTNARNPNWPLGLRDFMDTLVGAGLARPQKEPRLAKKRKGFVLLAGALVLSAASFGWFLANAFLMAHPAQVTEFSHQVVAWLPSLKSTTPPELPERLLRAA